MNTTSRPLDEIGNSTFDNASAIRFLPKVEKKLRILVAEDCPDTRTLIAHLPKTIGATTTLVVDGEECIKAALGAQEKNKPFDVILMDLRMPKVDGPTAVRTLRQAGYNHPIVAITSSPSLSDKAESGYIGCDHFLAKNSLVDTIVPALRDILNIK